MVNQFMRFLLKLDMEVECRIIRYLKIALDKGIMFQRMMISSWKPILMRIGQVQWWMEDQLLSIPHF